MSIVGEGGSAFDPLLIKRLGYGLLLAAVAVGVTAIFQAGAWVAAAEIALAAATAAVSLLAPEVFEVRNRGRGLRGFNPVFVGPAGIALINGIQANFVDAGALFLAAGLGALVGGGLATLRLSRPGLQSRAQFVTMLALVGAGLAAGAVGLVDVRFDASAPQPFRATISSMYVSHGKSTSYHLRLGPWGPMTAGDSVTVSSSLYAQLNPGDQVCLGLHPGTLSMAWFTVGACPSAA